MNEELLIAELKFKAVRSSGAGGQHVNKVASKVELQFSLSNSHAFTDIQKERLFKTLKTRLSKDGVLILQCGESRSQHKNKAIVTDRFLEVIKSGLVIPKQRKATKIPKAVILKRLTSKKQQAAKKAFRKKPDID